ncbi:MAG TPA: diguanylate cyclase [Spirochaetota bacterium]|nr:diguanylate cyclase [Spirochaetota bacterium]
MYIKTRIGLIVSGVFAAYLVIYVVLHFFWVISELREVEEEEALKDIQNVVSAIDREVDHIDEVCRDWSSWDDMYAFAAGPTGEFVRSNLNSETLENAGIDVFVIYSRQGATLFRAVNGSPGADIGRAEQKKLREELFARIMPSCGQPGAAKQGLSGIMRLEQTSIIGAVRSILTSTGAGPCRGIVVMGRFLDEKMIRRLNIQTNTSFSLLRHEDLKGGDREAAGLLKAGRKHVISRSGSRLDVYTEINGLFDEYTFIIKMASVGRITGKQYRIMEYNLVIGFLTNIAAMAALILLMRRFILGPVVNLTGQILSIRSSGDLSMRAGDMARNEMGVLADEFNRLLDELSLTHNDLINANRELQRIAVIDGLTGIPNRRRFDEAMDLEWRREKREGFPISLIMCDVDNFKMFNDTYGHQAGDECLRAIARVLSSYARRSGDLCARYGGEEFVVILPHTDNAGAMLIAERIRESAAALRIPHKGSEAGFVTLSLGVSTVQPEHSMDPATLIRAVDMALYEAKNLGRNRVVYREFPSQADE